jgi:hypothetical protein
MDFTDAMMVSQLGVRALMDMITVWFKPGIVFVAALDMVMVL